MSTSGANCWSVSMLIKVNCMIRTQMELKYTHKTRWSSNDVQIHSEKCKKEKIFMHSSQRVRTCLSLCLCACVYVCVCENILFNKRDEDSQCIFKWIFIIIYSSLVFAPEKKAKRKNAKSLERNSSGIQLFLIPFGTFFSIEKDYIENGFWPTAFSVEMINSVNKFIIGMAQNKWAENET